MRSIQYHHSQQWPAWIPSTQSTKVPLSPTSLCVDAGLSQADGSATRAR